MTPSQKISPENVRPGDIVEIVESLGSRGHRTICTARVLVTHDYRLHWEIVTNRGRVTVHKRDDSRTIYRVAY